MGQLAISRFRGETTFNLVARIISTFLGGLVGAVMWYISTGDGRGNPYGVLALYGVAFPFFFYFRLYWPGPLLINLMFFLTCVLVSNAARHFTLPHFNDIDYFSYRFLGYHGRIP